MATQRYISTSFWDDEWIQTLDPSEKFMYLYLLTNPLTNIAGVYKITARRISFDTGYNLDTITNILRKFEKTGKAHKFDEFIVIPSWPRHQQYEKRTKIRAGIEIILKDLSDDVLLFLVSVGYEFPLEKILTDKGIDTISIASDTLSVPYGYDSNYSDLDSDSDIDLDSDSYGVKPGAPEEAPAPSASQSPTIIEVLTNSKEPYPITQEAADLFQASYPGVDVIAELNKMKAWSFANPKNRKTQAGMMRFINGWLAKQQDRSGTQINSRYQSDKPRIANSALRPNSSREPYDPNVGCVVTDFEL